MDCFLCSATVALRSDEDLGDAFDTPPSFIESSCSEQSDPLVGHSSSSHSIKKVSVQSSPLFSRGKISPSALSGSRRMSTAIATTSDAKHPALVGRTIIALPDLQNGRTTISTLESKQSNMPRQRESRSKTPRSKAALGLPRSNRKERSSSNFGSSPKAVSPLPSGHQLEHKRSLHRASSDPSVRDSIRRFRVNPSPLRLEAWTEPAAQTYKVRGTNYLNDRVKQPSDQSAFRLLTVDLVQCEQPIYTGMCAHPSERVQQALKREAETGKKELPEFVFAVNLCIPASKTYHQVSYFGVDNFDEIEHQTTPFGRLMNQFIFGESDEFRNQTFKMIPKIVEGNYIVRKAVGSKPSIMGRKIKQYYVRGPNYFEIIIDIASDAVAQRIVKLCLGYTKTIQVDMMFLLEAASQQYLPERVFGGVRLKNIDFKEKDGKRVVARP